MSLPSEIKIVRQKSLLTQTQFAEQLGVSYTTVNRWEAGKAKPNQTGMKSLKGFCNANGIDFSRLENAWISSTVRE